MNATRLFSLTLLLAAVAATATGALAADADAIARANVEASVLLARAHGEPNPARESIAPADGEARRGAQRAGIFTTASPR